MKPNASQVIAGCFAMSAFAVALIAGLVAGNEAPTVLFRALLVMVLCYPVGLVAGFICQRAACDAEPEADEPVDESQGSDVAEPAESASGRIVDNEEILSV